MTKQKKDKGFIALYRNILDHWLWDDKPFSRGQAWIDLLLTVNHADKKIMFNGELTTIKRGQTITSIRQLCDRWGWSNNKVTRFLKILESEQMLTRKSDSKKTVITIDNYGFWQDQENEKRQQSDTKAFQKHNRSISEATQKHFRSTQTTMINNENNDKQCKTMKNKLCPELETSSRQNTNHDLFIELSLNDGSLFEVSDSDVQKWSKLYPAVDIKQELRKMKGWLDANPTKRKTRRGVKRFVNNWLSRTQDQGGTRGYVNQDKAEQYKQKQATRYDNDEDSLSKLGVDLSHYTDQLKKEKELKNASNR